MNTNPASVRAPASRPRPARTVLHRVAVSAPMRVSFAGGGSDVPPFFPGIGGRVVGTAIDIRVHVLVEPFDRGWICLEAPQTEPSAEPTGEGVAKAGCTVLTRRQGEPARHHLDFRLMEAALASVGVEEGARLKVHTEIGPGAGLGGSAAAAVAALCALTAAVGDTPDPHGLAHEATRIEREKVQNACGSQDQFFAAFGGLLDLSFDGSGEMRRTEVAASPRLLGELRAGFLLLDTNVRRISGNVLGLRKPTRESTAELVAAAADVVRGFETDSLDSVIEGMRRNAMAKLQRDPGASALAVDVHHKLHGLGAEVVRLCGAGAGGHVMVWAPPERHLAIQSALGACIVRRPNLGAAGARVEESASVF